MIDRFELIRVRKELRYTQLMLAEILGISKQYLSQMENGRKPLNNNAINFIEGLRDAKSGYDTLHQPKKAKKVDKQPLKTNKLQTRFSVKMKVAQLSDTPERKVAWERWWFKRKHPKCVACSRECKQSVHVGLYCPQFEEAT